MRKNSKLAFAAALIAIGALALAPAAGAKGPGGGSAKGGGKPSGGGGGGGGGTISLVMNEDANGDGQPNWNDRVRFNVSTTATSQPNVSVSCSQGGTVVYTAQTGYYDSYPWPWTQTFVLSSGAWTSGAADCSARLYSLGRSGGSTTLATMSFHVAA